MRTILIAITIALTGCTKGIITKGDNPNVVYISGEACTINATVAVSAQEFATLATWCTEQHQEFLTAN